MPMQHDPKFAETAEHAMQCVKDIVGGENGCLLLVFTRPNAEGMVEAAALSDGDPFLVFQALLSYLEKISASVGTAVHAPFLPPSRPDGHVH